MDLYIKDMLDANTTAITTMVDSLVIDNELPYDGLSFQSRRHQKVKRTFTISKDENGCKSIMIDTPVYYPDERNGSNWLHDVFLSLSINDVRSDEKIIRDIVNEQNRKVRSFGSSPLTDKRHIVYYHANCVDGIMAALAWYRRNDHDDSTYYYQPIQHGTRIPYNLHQYFDTVTFLDFCPPEDELVTLLEQMQEDQGHGLKTVTVIDHHKTTMSTLLDMYDHPPLTYLFTCGVLKVHFDMDESGASLVNKFDFGFGSEIIVNDDFFSNVTTTPIENNPIDKDLIDLVRARDIFDMTDKSKFDEAMKVSSYIFNSGLVNLDVYNLDIVLLPVTTLLEYGEHAYVTTKAVAEDIYRNCTIVTTDSGYYVAITSSMTTISDASLLHHTRDTTGNKVVYFAYQHKPNSDATQLSLRSIDGSALEFGKLLGEKLACEFKGHENACGSRTTELYTYSQSDLIDLIESL